MTRTKRLVLSAMVVVVGTATLAQSSYAGFTAQTTNPSNVFASGSLVLSNTKQGGSACLSTGAGTSTDTNVNNSCAQLLNLTVQKPGDSGTANLTIQNAGTVAATIFKLFAGTCTNGDAAGETYHGSGSLCSKVQLYIQQTNSSFSTPTACLYGGASGNTCDFSDTSKTLTAFSSTYTNSTNGLSIGSGLGAGSSTYFTIGVKLPSDADNTYQGRSATVSFSWFIQQ